MFLNNTMGVTQLVAWVVLDSRHDRLCSNCRWFDLLYNL